MVTNFEDAIRFAIEQEIKAAELYEKYAGIVTGVGTKKMLEDMADMERGHEAKLKAFKETNYDTLARIGDIPDLHVSDYLVEKDLNENSSIQDVFIFTMKAEQKAYELYSKLAAIELDLEKTHLFEELAEEEKQHKYSLEKEYESEILQEN